MPKNRRYPATPASAFAASLLATAILFAGTPLGAFATASDPAAPGVSAAIEGAEDGARLSRWSGLFLTDASTHVACPVTARAWDFGDGNTSTGENVSHSYGTLGTFTVTLDVTGECGATDRASLTVTVENALPSVYLWPSFPFMAVHEPVQFSAWGFDWDGHIVAYRFVVDSVALPEQPEGTLTHTFTAVGNHTVSVVAIDNDGGETASETRTVQVGPGPLTTLAVSPAELTLASGERARFRAEGFDAYGNPVTDIYPSWSTSCGSLWSFHGWSEVEFTAAGAPESGRCTLTASTWGGPNATATIQVVAGNATWASLEGPDALVVNTSGTFALVAFDAYNNRVPLANATPAYTAPTQAGSDLVCHASEGLRACKGVMLLADAPVALRAEGPDTVVVGTPAIYRLHGEDRYGNPTDVEDPFLLAVTPTVAGPFTIHAERAGLTMTREVLAVPDRLAALTLEGPREVPAGGSAEYRVSGADRYGNAVPLATERIVFEASTVAGPTTVCHTEELVVGCLEVTVVPGALHRVHVTPASSVVNVDRDLALAATGEDRYGNAIEGLRFAWEATHGIVDPAGRYRAGAPGAALVTATADGIAGAASLSVVDHLIVSVQVDAPGALQAATEGVEGVARVLFADGAASAGEKVAMRIARAVPTGQLLEETVVGFTDADGVLRFTVPATHAAPGDYRVQADAAWAGNAGSASASYHVAL